jgi:hypothetical protein
MSFLLQSAYRRIRYGKPIIVVSGLPRSGTSMAMKMLEAGGVEIVTDELRTADEDNPKGYFELERVKDLEKDHDKAWLEELRGRAVKIISFLLKDLPKSNNYKILFMHRNMEEILASQAKMLVRRGEESKTDDDKMREYYQNHLWKVKYLLNHQTHLDALGIHYNDVLEKPLEEAKKIVAFTGLDLDVKKMVGVVDEQLYRNRAK